MNILELKIKVSIITVCFNAVETIERTIRSVLSQSYANIEYIIIDGASTDGTVEIIKKYKTKISKFISEKDRGIYDAMNKGVALSTGDVINILNADDYYCDDHVVESAINVLELNKSVTLIYGKVEYINIPAGIKPWADLTVNSIEDFKEHTICHQTAFARRVLFSHIGGFDERYKYASDLDWIIKAYKYQPSGFYKLEKKLVYFSWVGSTYQHNTTSWKEASQIRLRHFFSLKSFWFYVKYFILRRIVKKLLNQEF